MPNFQTATDPSLDSVFHALADPTRRAVIAQLSSATEPASVSDLAKPFDMALPSFMQHLRVLENAALVISQKRGRQRWNYLDVAPIQRVYNRWIKDYAGPAAEGLEKLKSELE